MIFDHLIGFMPPVVSLASGGRLGDTAEDEREALSGMRQGKHIRPGVNVNREGETNFNCELR